MNDGAACSSDATLVPLLGEIETEPTQNVRPCNRARNLAFLTPDTSNRFVPANFAFIRKRE